MFEEIGRFLSGTPAGPIASGKGAAPIPGFDSCETGRKELIAAHFTIDRTRSMRAFVRVYCAAIPQP